MSTTATSADGPLLGTSKEQSPVSFDTLEAAYLEQAGSTLTWMILQGQC